MKNKDKKLWASRIATRIQLAMKRANLTPRGLAEKSGVSLSVVYYAQSGEKLLRAETYQDLCSALGISVSNLLKP